MFSLVCVKDLSKNANADALANSCHSRESGNPGTCN